MAPLECGCENIGYSVHAALKGTDISEQSCSTPPGLKPKQAMQALLTLGGDNHSGLSAICFLGSGTQSPGLAT